MLRLWNNLPFDAIFLFVVGFIGDIAKNIGLLGQQKPEITKIAYPQYIFKETTTSDFDINMASLLMINMCESMTLSVITQFSEKLKIVF